MTEREKFEEHIRSQGCDYNLFRCGDLYQDVSTHIKWKLWQAAWQAALASQQPADDGWIECCERMPDASDEYNVFLSGQVTTLWFSTEKKKWLDLERFSDVEFDNDEVTHWQPLPPPPEVV